MTITSKQLACIYIQCPIQHRIWDSEALGSRRLNEAGSARGSSWALSEGVKRERPACGEDVVLHIYSLPVPPYLITYTRSAGTCTRLSLDQGREVRFALCNSGDSVGIDSVSIGGRSRRINFALTFELELTNTPSPISQVKKDTDTKCSSSNISSTAGMCKSPYFTLSNHHDPRSIQGQLPQPRSNIQTSHIHSHCVACSRLTAHCRLSLPTNHFTANSNKPSAHPASAPSRPPTTNP